MWRDDYFEGYGRGKGYCHEQGGRDCGRGHEQGGRNCGRDFERGYGYGRGYMTKEELKDFYNYQKKRLELELEELNKAIQDIDKE
jgi:hypothetical protein